MVVYIIGVGHSGSTLLDMVLGSHPDMFSLGEIIHFPRSYDRNSTCACGKLVKQCDVWSQVGGHIDKEIQDGFTHSPLGLDLALSVSGRRWYQKLAGLTMDAFVEQTGLNSLKRRRNRGQQNEGTTFGADVISFYNIVKKVSGCSILIDSTKSAMRARALLKSHPHFQQKCIHLIRDGRGFVYSKLKKHFVKVSEGDSSPRQDAARLKDNASRRKVVLDAAKRWLMGNLFAQGVASSVSSDCCIRIKYEDFCRSPTVVSKQVCSFLGVGYEDRMLEFRSTTHHNIGGNAMRFSGEGILEPDQAWRNELHGRDLRTFNVIAGWLNYLYGYR